MKNKLINNTGLLCFLLVVVIPFFAGLIYSLLYSFGLTGILSSGFTTRHASTVIHDGEFFSSIAFSFYIAAASIFISLLIAIPGAIVFTDNITKSKKAFFVYMPLAIPSIVTAFISFQLLGKTGFISTVAYHAKVINGLQQFPDLINDRFGIGIITTHVLMATPFFLIFFSNLVVSERLHDLSGAAASLGANKFQRLSRVVIPVLFKRGFATIVLYFIFVFGSYEIPLILGRQSPQMISVLIVRKMQRFNLLDIPQGYFSSLLYTLLVIILLLIFLKPGKLKA
ncbi:MAG: ABC transporter permease subunit [Ginsengibacter sp.]